MEFPPTTPSRIKIPVRPNEGLYTVNCDRDWYCSKPTTRSEDPFYCSCRNSLYQDEYYNQNKLYNPWNFN